MSRSYKPGDEPVSGYRLARFLGRGGFGEVWQATAPGGTEVAFKIIDLGEKTGSKEWRAIQRVKRIRHPNLVPILAIWLRDEFGDLIPELPSDSKHAYDEQHPSELYLAMGLGDKSLLDRMKECKDQGKPGIPVAELINYIEDAARALDHLHSPKHDLGQGPVSIQHCDIKPQNILIVGDAAQVCDFGLARVLGENRSTANPAVTLAFAAPELLEEGKPGMHTDQYALAVTYYYLRTGMLPFSRNDTNTVMLEALEGRLDLSRLNAGEKTVIQQATARKPSSRFPTCVDMARELRRVVESGGAPRGTMVVEAGTEIVPGHKLVRCLGRGAYGEVWEALAPGRIPVALKIIRDLDRSGGRGKQEFKALEIIQRVSHSGLMELRAYWILDKHGDIIPDEIRGQPGSPAPHTLIIATKLADKNLGQLLDEYQAKNEPGIPPKELIGYLRQVAQALDYLNAPRHRLGERLVSIQHRDVKPDNIMLAGDAVKLTDFGLAKIVEFEEISAEINQDSVGFTFHYAAPEVLRGRVTKWSDQYALAITYYYLRTGTVPFERAGSAYELMMQQLEGRLDLSYLPENERRVIQRATMVQPEKRFHTCAAFIEELDKAIPIDGNAPLPKRPPPRVPHAGMAEGQPIDLPFSQPSVEEMATLAASARASAALAKPTSDEVIESLKITPLRIPPVPSKPLFESLEPGQTGELLREQQAQEQSPPSTDISESPTQKQPSKPIDKDKETHLPQRMLAEQSSEKQPAYKDQDQLEDAVETLMTEPHPDAPMSKTTARRRATMPADELALELPELQPISDLENKPASKSKHRRSESADFQGAPAKTDEAEQGTMFPGAFATIPPTAKIDDRRSSKQRIQAIENEQAKQPKNELEDSAAQSQLIKDWRKQVGTVPPKRSIMRWVVLGIVVFGMGIGLAALVLYLSQWLKLDSTTLAHHSGSAQTNTVPTSKQPGTTATSPHQATQATTRTTVPLPTPEQLSTKSIPPRILVLGKKDPTDADFTRWLANELDQQIVLINRPDEFTQVYDGLKNVPKELTTGKLQAFRAECLLEGSHTDLAQALTLADEAMRLGDAPAYAKYVRSRALQAAKEPIRAAALLAESLQSDVSLHGYRKTRAMAIFNDAAEQLTVQIDHKKLSARSSAMANDLAWLKQAQAFLQAAPDSHSIDLRLHLCLMEPDNLQNLNDLLTESNRRELARRPDGTFLVASLLFRRAEKLKVSQPESAFKDYVALVQWLKEDRYINEIGPIEFYQRLIQPALTLAKDFPVEQKKTYAASLAILYASKGRLIWNNPYESWNFNQPSYREAVSAFTEALNNEPSQGYLRAEYHTYRGLSLTRLGLDKLTPVDWKMLETDADGSIKADPSFSGGWNLKGLVLYQQAMEQYTIPLLTKYAQEARSAYNQAIDQADTSGKNDEFLSIYYSNRSVIEVLIGYYAPKAERRGIMEKAVLDGEKATQLSRESEVAWGAYGNALESLAWSIAGVGDSDYYPKADTAYQKQIQFRPAIPDGYINRGRLLTKWILDDQGDRRKVNEAEHMLEEALRLDPNHWETNYWLGRLRLWQKKVPEALAAFNKAVRDPHKGITNAIRLVLLLQNDHPKELLTLIDAALPAETSKREAKHAILLLERARLLFRQFKDQLPQAMLDADATLALADSSTIKAWACEVGVSIRYELALKTNSDEKKREYREQIIDRLKKLLQFEPDLPVAWGAARQLAVLLEGDATQEGISAEKRRELLTEALSYIRMAIDKAPADQKVPLQEIRNGLQQKLQQS